ncbi:MAG: peptide MFS transporter [Candidatus Kapabacteria bacterium]|nr:peptide MFS transporter [Candidatus Kapabacteria bacterium]
MAFSHHNTAPNPHQTDTASDVSGIGGHPRGLTTLFFTELWERFSYYGMRAILILYMVAPLTEGGLALDVKTATAIYGTYTMWVYLLALPGGFVADRWLGARRAVIAGGGIIALGHFLIALVAASTQILWFYAGLACITLGTGLLKPSISAMVGELYPDGDERRDAGFSLFFMGINVGAACAPIVCGFLAQHPLFKELLLVWGLNPLHSWHWGFGAAAVGMMIGLWQFLASQDRFQAVGERKHAPMQKQSLSLPALSREEWQRVGVIGILFVFTVLFGIVSEQAGSSMNLFADRLTRTTIGSWEFPSSWFQSVIPIYVIILAPLLSRLWISLGERQPSSPTKFALSLLFVGLAFSVMVAASLAARHGEVSPFWLLGAFFLQEIGAVLLNPTGLSVVTKLAPVRLVGMMMGVWFLASAVASRIAGYLAGFFDERNTEFLVQYFGVLSAVMMLAALILALLTPHIRRMMGGVK